MPTKRNPPVDRRAEIGEIVVENRVTQKAEHSTESESREARAVRRRVGGVPGLARRAVAWSLRASLSGARTAAGCVRILVHLILGCPGSDLEPWTTNGETKHYVCLVCASEHSLDAAEV